MECRKYLFGWMEEEKEEEEKTVRTRLCREEIQATINGTFAIDENKSRLMLLCT